MRYNRLCLLLVLFTSGSLTAFAQKAKTDQSVGEIAFDPDVDDPKFQFCNPTFVLQGYEVRNAANENRKWISVQLKERFKTQELWKQQNGFITVRFVVNCLGLTDRFRAAGVSKELFTIVFPVDLTKHLIRITKEIKWPVEYYKQQAIDYYQDVTFKVENGKLMDVIL